VRVARAPNGRAAIEVRDRGPGIPDSEREKIFAPFYRLAGSAETGRGSGLGLALVRQIARSHGGDALCLPADGGGSRLPLELPVVGWTSVPTQPCPARGAARGSTHSACPFVARCTTEAGPRKLCVPHDPVSAAHRYASLHAALRTGNILDSVAPGSRR